MSLFGNRPNHFRSLRRALGPRRLPRRSGGCVGPGQSRLAVEFGFGLRSVRGCRWGARHSTYSGGDGLTLETYDETSQLYLAVGDDVSAFRPVFAGDVYQDIEVPGTPGLSMAIVTAHPCTF